MMCINNRAHYGLVVVFICLHNTLPPYHYADVSEGLELVKCLSTIFCRVCTRWIFHAIYEVVCVQLTNWSYDECDNAVTSSYHHHQIGCMTNLPLFRVRSWYNAMNCMYFIFSLKKLHECTLNTSRPLWQLINPPQAQARGWCYIIINILWINLQ